MKQHPKSKNSAATPSALVCPACEKCGLPTRFVGLEAIVNSDLSDLCTYQCIACDHMQASVIPRVLDADPKLHASN